jgi:hypothetical protein
MRLYIQIDILVNQLGGVSRFIPVAGGWSVAGLPLGGALGYKVVGRAHIHDRITINTIY